MNKTDMTRRGFLRSCVGTALGSTLLYSAGGLLKTAGAAGVNDYKALVCVFLAGGNDAFNMLAPTDGALYSDYAASRGGLALARGDLHPMQGTGYGFHPVAADLATLFNDQKLAVVANCGNLVRPVSRDEYLNTTATLPPQLFSHSDQQRLWMTGDASGENQDGWGGRVADYLVGQGVPQNPAINFNFGGVNLFQAGQDSPQYSLTRQGKGYVTLHGTKRHTGGERTLDQYQALAQTASTSGNRLIREYAKIQLRSMSDVQLIKAGLDAATPLTTEFTTSDNQKFGRDLEVVAKMISARNTLGAQRQIFFVKLGGWDTHANQAEDHARLLKTLSTGLKEFNAALGELGVANQVTTFTSSEFGRTLSANGDGTDHGWGGHHLVMGGAVNGGQIIGRMPDFRLGGQDDAGKGRVIPELSNDQYFATLTRWFGLAENELDKLFPNLRNFSSKDLAFMNG